VHARLTTRSRGVEIFLLDQRLLEIVHADDVDDLGFGFGGFFVVIVFQEIDVAVFEET
jgi:hypothetical protein